MESSVENGGARRKLPNNSKDNNKHAESESFSLIMMDPRLGMAAADIYIASALKPHPPPALSAQRITFLSKDQQRNLHWHKAVRE